jgi:hypothetical protein
MPVKIEIHLDTGTDDSILAQMDDIFAAFGYGRSPKELVSVYSRATKAAAEEAITEAEVLTALAGLHARKAATEPETPAEAPAEPKAKRGRPAKAKPAEEAPKADPEPQIRANPENRVEEPEEDAIQDIQDEVAEVEAARDPVNPLTVDDVRQALGGYVKKYGTPAALEDGAKLLAQALGNPPEGEPIWKMSILPDDQDALRKAAEAVNAAIEGNPYGREAV